MTSLFRAALLGGAAVLAVSCASAPATTSVREASAPLAYKAQALGMPISTPEEQGFSTDGIDKLQGAMRDLVTQRKLAGVTTLVARHGKIVSFDTQGKANVATGQALEPDTIFRIASMTKPTIGVAMMQLWEAGKWKLDDPVSKYIPEFANLKVKTTSGGTEPMATPMTMRQLMSHTAGFDVSAGYQNANLQATDLQGMIDKLAKLPLADQPGTDWNYGPSVDIQGYLVEKLSGQKLDVYMAEHIFKPLGMVDTGFWVSPDKAGRVATIHTYDPQGFITAPTTNPVKTEKPAFLSGSGGLMSTAKDYWRFAQCVLDNYNGKGAVKLLKADTIKLMRTNVLQPGVMVDLYGPTQPGIGFGLDFAIVMDPAAAKTSQGLNTFYWGGAFGTWFWIDPTNDLVFVGMIQNINGSTPGAGTPAMREISPRLTYAALTNK